MGLQEHEELDAIDQQEVEMIEAAILEILDDDRPATISQLSEKVRERVGDVDNAVIRAALLRLLNRDAFAGHDGDRVPVA